MGPTEGRIWDLERRVMQLEYRLPRVEATAIGLGQGVRQADRELATLDARRRPGDREPDPWAGIPESCKDHAQSLPENAYIHYVPRSGAEVRWTCPATREGPFTWTAARSGGAQLQFTLDPAINPRGWVFRSYWPGFGWNTIPARGSTCAYPIHGLPPPSGTYILNANPGSVDCDGNPLPP